eukprot:2562915-Prymnesium_polylepis.1
MFASSEHPTCTCIYRCRGGSTGSAQSQRPSSISKYRIEHELPSRSPNSNSQHSTSSSRHTKDVSLSGGPGPAPKQGQGPSPPIAKRKSETVACDRTGHDLTRPCDMRRMPGTSDARRARQTSMTYEPSGSAGARTKRTTTLQ